MFHWIINRRLNAAEKKLGVSVDYLRHIAMVSLTAFFKFVKFMPLAEYRKKLPADAWHIARLVAVKQEDCGSCVQIEVNLAQQNGVDAVLLRHVINQDVDKLPPELANVYLFAKAISTQQDEPDLRELIRIEYGEEGLVELALTISACRVFPTTKRALGYATNCSRVDVKL